MDTLKFSDSISKHIVEARELWGYKYYIEVEPDDSSSRKQILELKDTSESLLTDVFGGGKLD